jgi:N-acetylglucosamine kinase-like BadF-type ATPase
VTRYVVAADGGNSKTDIVLASDAGEILSRVQVAGTRPHRHGMAATMRALADGVHLAMERADLPITPAVALADFCLANIDVPEEEAAAQAELERLGVADVVLVHNDTFAVLRAGATAGWGVAVVSGAGINAVGVHPDGRQHRFLALGPETGDWGGGEAVAVAGLGAAIRAGDGRGPDTVLRTVVPEALGRPSAEVIALELNRGKLQMHSMLALAPVVLVAATGGDAMATEIVVRLADEVVDFAAAALRGLDLLESAAEVVLGGGMLQSGNPILLDRIRDQLHATAPSAVLTVLDVAPVAGALVDALMRIGADPLAVARARTALRC